MFLIFRMTLDTGILPPPLCAILKALFYKGVKFPWPSGGVSVTVSWGQQDQVEMHLANGGLPQSCVRAQLLFSLTLGLSPFVGGLCSRPRGGRRMSCRCPGTGQGLWVCRGGCWMMAGLPAQLCGPSCPRDPSALAGLPLPPASRECFDLIWFDLGNCSGFSDLTRVDGTFSRCLACRSWLWLLCETGC